MITLKPFKLATLLAGPIVFALIILLVPDSFISPGANKTLALGGWMITWWITEAAPIAVTALLPLVIFPFLGIMKMSEAAAPYSHPAIFLFMGGFMIAIALEKHRLHERIALNLLRLTGTSARGVILGFTIATGALSMWISNTATAMMMLPIALSVIDLLKRDSQAKLAGLNKDERNFALGLLLSIGYAASIGGVATIVGTPPNVVFKGLLEQHFNARISFGQWLLFGLPISITLLASCYFLVTRLLFPSKLGELEGTADLLESRLQELGSIKLAEKKVLSIFILTSFLWIFQQPINDVIGRDIFNDTNIAILGGVLLFIIPADLKSMEPLLEWRDTKNLQWGILILFGGGLCLAEGLENTHIIEQFGQYIAGGQSYNNLLLLMLIIAAVFLTEIMSNVALVQIFVPVIFGISTALGVNPIVLALPVTISASMAFMFPISTPPNAVVFSTGYIRIRDMVVAGFTLNVISILVIWLFSILLLPVIF